MPEGRLLNARWWKCPKVSRMCLSTKREPRNGNGVDRSEEAREVSRNVLVEAEMWIRRHRDSHLMLRDISVKSHFLPSPPFLLT